MPGQRTRPPPHRPASQAALLGLSRAPPQAPTAPPPHPLCPPGRPGHAAVPDAPPLLGWCALACLGAGVVGAEGGRAAGGDAGATGCTPPLLGWCALACLGAGPPWGGEGKPARKSDRRTGLCCFPLLLSGGGATSLGSTNRLTHPSSRRPGSPFHLPAVYALFPQPMLDLGSSSERGGVARRCCLCGQGGGRGVVVSGRDREGRSRGGRLQAGARANLSRPARTHTSTHTRTRTPITRLRRGPHAHHAAGGDAVSGHRLDGGRRPGEGCWEAGVTSRRAADGRGACGFRPVPLSADLALAPRPTAPPRCFTTPAPSPTSAPSATYPTPHSLPPHSYPFPKVFYYSSPHAPSAAAAPCFQAVADA